MAMSKEKSGGMKSALELAMERLDKKGVSPASLTGEQREKLAVVERELQAKIAELAPGLPRKTLPDGRVSQVRSIVEKPAPEDARSNLAVVGRYVLTPAIFKHLEQIPRGAGGEIQLTDAIEKLLCDESVLAYRFEGKRYDCGSKLGYLQATVEYALEHPELRDDFLEYLVSEFGQRAKKLLRAIDD